jgi:outer membrane lipase/esterase
MKPMTFESVFMRGKGTFVPTIAAAALCSFQVAAAGPLDDFARENGTSVQVDIAEAITAICPALVGTFGGMPDALSAPDSERKDITLRCNELIGTAMDLSFAGSAQRSLGYTQIDDLLAALQQVTGEEIAAQNTMTVRAANSQFSNIAGRLGALRLAAGGAGATGPASAFNFNIDGVGLGTVTPVGAGYLGGGASADDETGLRRGGMFVNGSYNTGDRDASALEDGFDFDVLTGTLGFDYRFDTGVIGVSAGYDRFDADFERSALVAGGKVEATGTSASLFAMKEIGNFFIDGIATYGQLDYDIDRILSYQSNNTDPACQCPDQERTIVSASEGDHLTVSATAGWQIFRNEWLIQPTLGLSSRNYQIDGYVEQDSLATGGMELRYGDQDVDSLRSVLGLQVSRASNRQFGVMRPWFTMEWYHEFEDEQNTFAAKYAQEDVLAVAGNAGFSSSLTGCLSCFSVSSAEPDTDFGVIGAGLSFVFPNFVQFLVYYEGLVGYEDLTSHAITLNFRSQF